MYFWTIFLISIFAAAGMFAIAIMIVYVMWEHLGLKELNAKFEQSESDKSEEERL